MFTPAPANPSSQSGWLRAGQHCWQCCCNSDPTHAQNIAACLQPCHLVGATGTGRTDTSLRARTMLLECLLRNQPCLFLFPVHMRSTITVLVMGAQRGGYYRSSTAAVHHLLYGKLCTCCISVHMCSGLSRRYLLLYKRTVVLHLKGAGRTGSLLSVFFLCPNMVYFPGVLLPCLVLQVCATCSGSLLGTSSMAELKAYTCCS